MKTRFSISQDVFSTTGTLNEMYKYYEDVYKKHGFILDKRQEDVYKDFNKEIQLNEGDRVDLQGFRIVDWKCVDLDSDLIIYSLIEE
jgi:hypothetical protein